MLVDSRPPFLFAADFHRSEERRTRRTLKKKNAIFQTTRRRGKEENLFKNSLSFKLLSIKNRQMYQNCYTEKKKITRKEGGEEKEILRNFKDAICTSSADFQLL